MQRLLSFGLALIILWLPAYSWAAENNALVSPILITEMQAGTTQSASQEFIELYNRSPHAITLADDRWQLEIASSTASDWSRAKKVALTGTFYPGTYILIASNYIASGDTSAYLAQYASASFTSGLTYQAGHVRLVTVNQDGSRQTHDSLEWTTHDAKGSAINKPIEGHAFLLDAALEPDESIKRKIDVHSMFMATGDAAKDFAVSHCPSPTATNTLEQAWQSDDPKLLPEAIATDIDIDDPLCELADEQSDTDTPLEQADSDPPSVLIPGEASSVGSAAQTKSIPAGDKGLKRPQLSELLPNPAKPQTDAADEFIELYNPNQTAFDLSGFKLMTGTTKTKVYTFPEGEMLPAGSFKAFFSGETHLSLSNTNGQVRLLDPQGTILDTSEAYQTAKEGQAWVKASGIWQWTTVPTPNATNVIKAPVSKAQKKATKKATSSSKVKNKRVSAPASKDITATAPVSNIEQTPLHGGVLAVIGGFALLYGAYEYRRDVANKIHQFRLYRAARRAARQSTSRRRGS